MFHKTSESRSAFSIWVWNGETASYTLIVQKHNIFLATVHKAVTSWYKMVSNSTFSKGC